MRIYNNIRIIPVCEVRKEYFSHNTHNNMVFAFKEGTCRRQKTNYDFNIKRK